MCSSCATANNTLLPNGGTDLAGFHDYACLDGIKPETGNTASVGHLDSNVRVPASAQHWWYVRQPTKSRLFVFFHGDVLQVLAMLLVQEHVIRGENPLPEARHNLRLPSVRKHCEVTYAQMTPRSQQAQGILHLHRINSELSLFRLTRGRTGSPPNSVHGLP